MAKAPHNGPASGMGWGDAPKGAAVARREKAPPFAVGNKMAAGPRNVDRAERNAALKTRLYDIGMAGEAETASSVQVQAANAWLDRDEGKARQAVEVSGPNGEALPAHIAVSFVSPTK